LHVAYDDSGIGQILQWLKPARPALIVVEATGGLEIRLASEMAGAGQPLAVTM